MSEGRDPVATGGELAGGRLAGVRVAKSNLICFAFSMSAFFLNRHGQPHHHRRVGSRLFDWFGHKRNGGDGMVS